jgi:G-protein alpha subunit
MDTPEKQSLQGSKEIESPSSDPALTSYGITSEGRPSLLRQALRYLDELTAAFGGNSSCSSDTRRSQAIDSQLEQDWEDRRNMSVILALGRDIAAVVQALSLLQSEADRATEPDECKKYGMFRETVLAHGSHKVSIFELFNMTDRRKWLHQFDSVAAILFTVDLSQFDKVWSNGVCQLRDDVTLFDSVVNSSSLSSPPAIILLLTHASEFYKKAMTSGWGDLFPEFDWAMKPEQISDFVLNLFTEVNRTKKELYPLIGDLNDPVCLHHVFNSMEKIRVPKSHLETRQLGTYWG